MLTSCTVNTDERVKIVKTDESGSGESAPPMIVGTDTRVPASRPLAEPGGFYKLAPVFSTRPSEKPSLDRKSVV